MSDLRVLARTRALYGTEDQLTSRARTKRSTAAMHTPLPQWVNSGHPALKLQCPFYPRKRTSLSAITMSALCQEEKNGTAAKFVSIVPTATGPFTSIRYSPAAQQRPEACRFSACSRVAFYSMILSARTSRLGEILSPSDLAAFMLIHNSSAVANSTGKSAGLAPFIILSTKYASRLKHQSRLTP